MEEASRYTIAVVDDDFRMLESLEKLLEAAGHRVHVFVSAEAFLEAKIVEAVDCLISDVGMPGMGGFELSRLIHLCHPRLPIFLITGRKELIGWQTGGHVSSSRFFVKPFDGKQLLRAVAVALTEASK